MPNDMFMGLDIGSVSVKAVLMTPGGDVLETCYRRTRGLQLETALAVLEDMLQRRPHTTVSAVALTGSGAAPVAGLLNCLHVNEIIAHAAATARLHPGVRTIIEMGGEDSKLILLDGDSSNGRASISDIVMNSVCAAGTGSFLDQQAARLGVAIEDAFGALALKSTHPANIAGRCSVFAKSDMIHLQQIATPEHDIIMGLCIALARTVKGSLVGARHLKRPVAFQGGVAANRGMIRALQDVLGLSENELVVPRHFALMGAVGAVLIMTESGGAGRFGGLERLQHFIRTRKPVPSRLCALSGSGAALDIETRPAAGDAPCDAFLGVDVGSISTNLVLIDRQGGVIARRYLMTAGQPIEAVRRGLDEIGREVSGRAVVRGAATTGSGRYLIGDFIGADFIKNEITAHARGALAADPRVDTIFEIGGQDSKYISLDNGTVVDFTMNKVCAAGTGSFLEEQAERLGISIKDEFSDLALSAKNPADLGERCTVFMESSLTSCLRQGTPASDIAAGLCYSVVFNYLNRVVENRRVGDVIFFQGGTAYNRGVRAAFEQVCGTKITVPPHHDVLGAIGCALIARDAIAGSPTRFRGFDLAGRSYELDSFTCSDCPNACEIRSVRLEGEKPLCYGSRCGKFDEKRHSSATLKIPDLFAERERMLLSDCAPGQPVPPEAPCVGLPRTTLFFELYPFWQAFLAELGFRVRLSPPTNRAIIRQGCELSAEEFCFPIKVAHGHIRALLEEGVDYLLLPCVVNGEPVAAGAPASYNCPYVQALPFVADAALGFSGCRPRVLSPVLHFEWGPRVYEPQLRNLARMLGRRGRAAGRAIRAGRAALEAFQRRLQERGHEVLAGLPEGIPSAVIVGRPYNTCDPGLNLRLPDKLRELGAQAVPLDFLPLDIEPPEGMKTMYWRYGQRILSAARIIAGNERLSAVYLSNFSCGPDSFITKYFEREMNGKPYLAVEIDEHSADAGLMTRLEAFLDSSARTAVRRPAARPAESRRASSNHRTVYVPYMDDHGLMLAAAMLRNGIRAEALPMSDEETLELGRRHTSGRECYPCILTTGDIVKKALSPGFRPDRSGFLMPSALGPCRFGQYNRFHRQVLDALGLNDVPVMILDQNTDYESSLQGFGSGFRLLAWQGIVFVDMLKKLLLHTRPYERTKGDSDDVYRECLERAMADVRHSGTLKGCSAYAAERFSAIAVDRRAPRPLIGIVGEIYVRSNRFSNGFFIDTIGELGGEAVMPTMQEWVRYTDWERRKDLRREGDFYRYGIEQVKSAVQTAGVKKISNCFKADGIPFFADHPTAEAMKLCSPYSSEHLRGEANLSLGRAVEYARSGIHGVANLIPFGCMPGTIVNALLGSFARDYPGVPVLKMVYDGTEQAGDRTRIEAFMYRARQALEASRNT